MLERATVLECKHCRVTAVVKTAWASRDTFTIEPNEWKDLLLPDEWSISIHADAHGMPDANVFYCPQHKRALYAVAYELQTSDDTWTSEIEYTHARTPLEAVQNVATPFEPAKFKLVGASLVVGIFGDERGRNLTV